MYMIRYLKEKFVVYFTYIQSRFYDLLPVFTIKCSFRFTVKL